MLDEIATDVRRWLAAWELSDQIHLDEIEHLRRASRTWHVCTLKGRYVAKLTFDRPRYVEPGLRVAYALANAGIRTGRPVLTRNDRIAVTVGRQGQPWTLAVLEYVPGAPLDTTQHEAAGLAGDLLGRVHSTLLDLPERPQVPARTLVWLRDFLTSRRDPIRLAVLAEITEYQVGLPLTECIIYGDPSPEILYDQANGSIGLIDWGTPSWGPLVYDLATWAGWINSQSPDAAQARADFLAAYYAYETLTDADDGALPLFERLVYRPPSGGSRG